MLVALAPAALGCAVDAQGQGAPGTPAGAQGDGLPRGRTLPTNPSSGSASGSQGSGGNTLTAGGRGAVVLAARRACVVRNDGALLCSGDDGTLPQASQVASSLGAVTTVALADTFACALLKDGSVACWGDNAEGQLGRAEGRNAILGGAGDPSRVDGVKDARTVAAGKDFACVTTTDGVVGCWGRRASYAAVAMPDGRGATQVVAGDAHGCALLDDGTVACWAAAEPAARIAGVEEITALAAAGGRTCAASKAGEVRCWGAGSSPTSVAMPMTGTLTTQGAPARVVALALGSTKASGAGTSSGDYACALTDGGSVACWGENRYGQCGLAPVRATHGEPRVEAPSLVKGVHGAVSLSAGGGTACVVQNDDDGHAALACWGKKGLSWPGFTGAESAQPNPEPQSLSLWR